MTARRFLDGENVFSDDTSLPFCLVKYVRRY